MTMSISVYQMEAFFGSIDDLTKDGIKDLSQKERKDVDAVARAVIFNRPIENKKINLVELGEKINGSMIANHPRSNVLVRIWKGFLNILGLRISSESLYKTCLSAIHKVQPEEV